MYGSSTGTRPYCSYKYYDSTPAVPNYQSSSVRSTITSAGYDIHAAGIAVRAWHPNHQYGGTGTALTLPARPCTTTAWSIQHDAEDMRCVNHSFGDGPTRSHLRPHRGIEHPTDFAIRLRRANTCTLVPTELAVPSGDATKASRVPRKLPSSRGTGVVLVVVIL